MHLPTVGGVIWRVLCFLLGLVACPPAFAQLFSPKNTGTNADDSPLFPAPPPPESDYVDPGTGMTVKANTWGFIDPIKEAEILKMMGALKVKERMEKMKQGLLERLRAGKPGVAQEIWDRVAKDMDVDALFQRQIAIYDKHFTLDDLKAVNAFYATPAGQRYLSLMPPFNLDIDAANKLWLQQSIVKVGLDLQDAKRVIPSASPPTNFAPLTSPAPATNSVPIQPSLPVKSAPFHPAPASHEA